MLAFEKNPVFDDLELNTAKKLLEFFLNFVVQFYVFVVLAFFAFEKFLILSLSILKPKNVVMILAEGEYLFCVCL